MKELNYSHLRLDNFTSFQSDPGIQDRRRVRKEDGNKENQVVTRSKTQNGSRECLTDVNKENLAHTPTTSSIVDIHDRRRVRKEDGNKENQTVTRSKTQNGSRHCLTDVNKENFSHTPTTSSIVGEVFGVANTPLPKRGINGKGVDYQNLTHTASSITQGGVLSNISNYQPHSTGSPTVFNPTVNVSLFNADEVFRVANTPLPKRGVNAKGVDYHKDTLTVGLKTVGDVRC